MPFQRGGTVNDQPAVAAPGWYRDPFDSRQSIRYWDGRQWTEHSQPIPEAAPHDAGDNGLTAPAEEQEVGISLEQSALERAALDIVSSTERSDTKSPETFVPHDEIAQAYAALGNVNRDARAWIIDNSLLLQSLGLLL